MHKYTEANQSIRTPDLTQATSALVTLPHAVKGRRGFLKVAKKNQRSITVAFRVTVSDAEFIDAYCDKYGMTRTELLLRSLTFYTGYNGENIETM
jgi:hypothetical protein